MSPQNFTIDDCSPLISYTPPGTWRPGSKSNDPEAAFYSDGGTFTVTETSGSKASFTFNGTYVYLYGAKRFNHGNYSVELDGVTKMHNGSSPDHEQFQALLDSYGPLAQDVLHTVTFESRDSNYLDLDFITWTSDLGLDDSSRILVQDDHPSFSYAGPWTITSVGGRYEGGAAHQAINGDSSVTLSFSGESISLYGSVGNSYGRYTAQLDGGEIQVLNATRVYTETQVLLYHANNIGNGTHSLTIANSPVSDRPNSSILIDYALYIPTNTMSERVEPTVASESKKIRLSTGALVGVSFGGVILLAVIVLAVFFIVRRRKRTDQVEAAPSDSPSRSSQDGLIQPYEEHRATYLARKPRLASHSPDPAASMDEGAPETLPPDYDAAVGPSIPRHKRSIFRRLPPVAP
ncbi:hypothetical protein HDZ31DRAFT_61284 [Schizophyllum fasciatum]